MSVLATALLLPGSALAASAREADPVISLCSPALMGDVRPACFPPSAAPRLELHETALVVTPRGLVWTGTHLRLREVSIERWSGGFEAIDYLFGRLPADLHSPPALGVPQYNARRPLYVLVREARGRGLDKKPVLFEARGGSGPGAWHFSANFPGRDLEFSVTTNESRPAAEGIGRALLRRAASSSPRRGAARG